MTEPRFEDLPAEEQAWIDACLAGTIDEKSFTALQDRMLERPELRKIMRRSIALHHDLQAKAEGTADTAAELWLESEATPANVDALPAAAGASRFFPMAIAAGLAFLLGLAFMHFGGRPGIVKQAAKPVGDDPVAEPSANGFAVIENLVDAQWAPDESERRRGDSLGNEIFRLQSGVAEIQFFSGATMVIEGPAEIALKSAWEATCRKGLVRMRVPPAARGFKLNGPDTEIVDLGTEFGFEVRDGKAHVEVIEGEISMRHRNADERIVEKGAAWKLPSDGIAAKVATGQVVFPDMGSFDLQTQARQRKDFERWQAHSKAFARDQRVIAYYTFDRAKPTAVIASLAEPRSSEFDGAVVLAETAAGRWPGMKQALEFRRPGSRVRVRIPGEFEAFTFAAWVRIDSLDRRYTALFMGDGYENGEPHWQIRDDGMIMLSIMIDDTGRHPIYPKESRYHHVYFSPSIWNRSMSGRWIHVASVFDPEGERVSHYVNGERISEEKIEPLFQIQKLRIGNGEIGNWGQPFRENPGFAIRNLNGRIDELAILNAALTDAEISGLHQRSQAGRN
jgi:hypothetical protein